MSKVTVDDVVHMTPRELINKMTTKGEEPAEEALDKVDAKADEELPAEVQSIIVQVGVPERVPAPEQVAVTVDQTPLKQEFNKQQLKGIFDDAHIFVKGQTFGAVHGISGGTVEVTSVENSSGRVKFKVQETGEIFSQAAAVLRGGKEELPYKKGDTVIFEGREFEVIGLNPANRNVVIMLDGKKRYLKISKVTAGGLVQGKIPSDGE